MLKRVIIQNLTQNLLKFTFSDTGHVLNWLFKENMSTIVDLLLLIIAHSNRARISSKKNRPVRSFSTENSQAQPRNFGKINAYKMKGYLLSFSSVDCLTC